MRDDKCKIKIFFCFEWKDFFYLFKYSNLLGDFFVYFGYVFFEFYFVVYCNFEYFKIFSNWNSNVFVMELGFNLGFFYYNCLVF